MAPEAYSRISDALFAWQKRAEVAEARMEEIKALIQSIPQTTEEDQRWDDVRYVVFRWPTR